MSKLGAGRGLLSRISPILIAAGVLFIFVYNAEDILSREVKVLLFFVYAVLVFSGVVMVVVEFFKVLSKVRRSRK
jgi:hypothetical protein